MTLVEPPDTALARQATELVHDCCDAHIAAHCTTTSVSHRDFRDPNDSRCGVNAVRTMVCDAGMPAARAEGVWDVIALHASTAIAAHTSVETRIANRGISIDVRGAGVDSLPPDAVRAVLDTWPRRDFPSAFSQTLVDGVCANPSAVRSSWMEGIAIARVHGFEAADFLATQRSSEHFV